MSINYSSRQTVITNQSSQIMPPPPVIYVTTSDNKLVLYHLISLTSDRPSLFKPVKIIDKQSVKNGQVPDGFPSSSEFEDDSDDSCARWEREKEQKRLHSGSPSKMSMEPDYSLQFRLIRQVEIERTKFLDVSVSSDYGFALLLKSMKDNNFDKKDIITEQLWTDVIESHQYDYPETTTNYVKGEASKMWIVEDKISKKNDLFYKLNCTGRVLAKVTTYSYITFYDATQLAPKTMHPIRPLHGATISKSPAKIKMLEWNPKNPAMFVVAFTETLYTVLFDFEDESSRKLAKTFMNAPITALSWNSAGTQLFVGDADGRVHQFNPKLKFITSVNPPNLIPSVFPDIFVCSGLCWVSKTERIVVFTSETSDKLHLTKLTVKPNKPPKWTVWDVLPAVEDKKCSKTFNFLSVNGWDTVLMSSPCLSEVYTFSRINNIWQPLKLDECFTIQAPIEPIFVRPYYKRRPEEWYFSHLRRKTDSMRESVPPMAADLHKFKKAFITSMSLNYSSQQNVITGKAQTTPPQPVVYITTSHGALLVYQMVSLNSDRPSLVKPAEIIVKELVKNGPREPFGFDRTSSTDSDASTTYSHSGSEYEAQKATYTHRRQKKGTSTMNYEKDAGTQTNSEHRSSAIMKLRKEIMRLREIDINAKKDLANFTCLRLREAGKLSAYGVLEVYAAENENFNKIRDTKERWTAMYHGDAKLIAEMKRFHCKLSADEFVAAVLSILSKPVARIMNLDTDGLAVKGSDFFRVENAVLEVVCGVMLVKFTIV
uniref:ANAPC4_WD40 domain-containing protein n=1 Tax=Panagrellus redivivus TaxID=6233 RepID=A0A7E4VRU6_PANRE